MGVLVVGLGSTAGLRAAEDELVGSLRRAGAGVRLARARPRRDVRTLALTDLAWALAARDAAVRALREEDARAVVYVTTTAALLWPRPGAIRFDALAAANRPGRHGVWQRPLERRRLAQAPLLVPQDAAALGEADVLRPADAARPRAAGSRRPYAAPPDAAGSHPADAARPGAASAPAAGRVVVVPIPVEPSGPPAAVRDVAAVTYATNPFKKGLDRVVAAWAAAAPDGELVVAGVDDGPAAPGVRYAGALAPDAFRALLRRARVYVTAPRREDYGLAQLEALADGCRVVTTPAPGPYAALPLLRDGLGWVSDDAGLPGALRAALADDDPGFPARALAAIVPFRRDAVDRVVADELLPRLLA